MVNTSPHGEGNVRDHVNLKYDTDENGKVDVLQDNDLTIGAFDASDTSSGLKPWGLGIKTEAANLMLQNTDDSAPAGGLGSYAGITGIDQAGHRMGTITFDRGLQQLGFYIADTDLDTLTSDNQPAKAFNIEGGHDYVEEEHFKTYVVSYRQTSSGVSGLPTNEMIVSYDVATGNNWMERVKENGANQFARVYDSGTGAMRHYAYNAATATDGYYLDVRPAADTIEWAQEWTQEGFTIENDTSTNRPASPVVGRCFFDTTLGQPIWYDGAGWVDAQGAAV